MNQFCGFPLARYFAVLVLEGMPLPLPPPPPPPPPLPPLLPPLLPPPLPPQLPLPRQWTLLRTPLR